MTLKYNNMVNNILKPYYFKNRDVIVRYTVDKILVEVDINIVKQYVKPEHLDDLKLKWDYSKTKGNYIGFKVTVTMDNKSKCPISILIHPDSPHDSKIFDNVLKELKKGRLFKKRIIFYSTKVITPIKTTKIGLNIYKIIPIIFPRYYKTTQKLEDNLSYPLYIYNSRTYEEDKQEFNHLKHILIEYINNNERLKTRKRIKEDFFKVGKDVFGLGKFHKYTTRSVTKSIYLCMLLTAICVQ